MLAVWVHVLLFALLLLGMPLGVAMGLSGTWLLYHVAGDAGLVLAAKTMFDALNDYTYLVIPLFVMVGAIMVKGGVADDLFEFFDSMLGHIPGGVGVAVVLTAAVLAAMSGSSVGVAAAIGPMAVANLQKRGYSLELSLGLPASAGGLGILIPPSVGVIAYSALTGVSPAKMLIAGVVPGLLCVVLFAAYSMWAYWRTGQGKSVRERRTWSQRWKAFKRAFWALSIPVILLGGIYSGITTITEVAAVACVWALIVCMFVYRRMTWRDLLPTLRHGLSLSAMVMFLIATALLLGNAITVGGVTEILARALFGHEVPLWAFIVITMVWLLILGIALEGASMLFLTIPVVAPLLAGYGYDFIAYGVLYLLNVELSLLSPPVGLTVQTMERIGRQMGLPLTASTAWRGCIPFFALYVVVMILVAVFPGLATWLPSTMK